MPLIDIDRDVFERSFGRAPAALRHRLADHPPSLSITFHTPACADEIVLHRLDASLRRLRLSPAQIGRRSHSDRVRIAAGRGSKSGARRVRGRR